MVLLSVPMLLGGIVVFSQVGHGIGTTPGVVFGSFTLVTGMLILLRHPWSLAAYVTWYIAVSLVVVYRVHSGAIPATATLSKLAVAWVIAIPWGFYLRHVLLTDRPDTPPQQPGGAGVKAGGTIE